MRIGFSLSAVIRKSLGGCTTGSNFSFVCKEAVLSCPESSGKDPVALPFGGGIGKVLLMANDLLPKRVTGPAPTAEQMINVLSEFIPIAEASGFNKAVHKIVRSHLMLDHYPNNGRGEIEEVFKQGTGISLDLLPRALLRNPMSI